MSQRRGVLFLIALKVLVERARVRYIEGELRAIEGLYLGGDFSRRRARFCGKAVRRLAQDVWYAYALSPRYEEGRSVLAAGVGALAFALETREEFASLVPVVQSRAALEPGTFRASYAARLAELGIPRELAEVTCAMATSQAEMDEMLGPLTSKQDIQLHLLGKLAELMSQ